MRWVLLVGLTVAAGLAAGCASTIVIVDDVPTATPTEEELCAADRDPDYPCLTADGASLELGACCVAGGGNLGTCTRESAVPGGDILKIPRCNYQL